MNLLFAGHDFKFARLLMEHFRASDNWTVLEDRYAGHVIKDTDRSEALRATADVIFCEWCLGNAEWYSHHKEAHQRLVIRLHSQEMGLPFLDRIAWDAVDALVFICPTHMNSFLERFPDLRSRARLIYNLVDCDAFDGPKQPDVERVLGFMGTAPMIKWPHLALEIVEELRRHDDRFRLRIKGRHPWEYDWLWRRDNERAYYEALYARLEALGDGSVAFDPHGDDVPEWFGQLGFILSTSEREGSHQAVAEGMAAGTVPVIRNWDGAAELYPPEYVFETVDDAVRSILDLLGSGRLEEHREQCRDYARERFDRRVIIAAYEELLGEILSATISS